MMPINTKQRWQQSRLCISKSRHRTGDYRSDNSYFETLVNLSIRSVYTILSSFSKNRFSRCRFPTNLGTSHDRLSTRLAAANRRGPPSRP